MSKADDILRRLLELHDLQKRQLAHDYDAVRKIRREAEAVWSEAREYLHPTPASPPAGSAKGKKNAGNPAAASGA